MTVFADFTPDEQRLLATSLRAAAIVVSTASPGRPEETASEGFAAASLALSSRDAYVGNSLVSSVILELEHAAREERPIPEYASVASEEGAGDRARQTLRDVVTLLDARATPDEATGYKRWLLAIATATAEAGKEDQGFLGMGGVLVNDAERAALDEIAALLGVTP